nr:MAG TPA: hypothetical protein [Caudoviricetes sp.]
MTELSTCTHSNYHFTDVSKMVCNYKNKPLEERGKVFFSLIG